MADPVHFNRHIDLLRFAYHPSHVGVRSNGGGTDQHLSVSDHVE